MDLVLPAPLSSLDLPEGPPAAVRFAVIIAAVRVIAAAELRMLLLYEELERDYDAVH